MTVAALHAGGIFRVLAVASALDLAACCLSSISGSDHNDAGEGPPQCASAGGNCILPLSCAGTILSAYDCNPERNPAGGGCCLANLLEDAGPDAGQDAGADAGPDARADSGAPDSGFEIDAGMCGPASGLTTSATYPLSMGEYVTSADLNGDGLLDLVAGQFVPDSGFGVL